MAIKKSELYSSIWASCDELRGGMDASQYKDYVLFMLFIKYISDKYGDSEDFKPPVTIPKGAGFKDMIALKGKSDIGDKINTQVIQPLIDSNSRLARSDFPNFNDPNKLGEGQAMVERLTNLIAIFQKPELDFSKNRAENDDILGDAYEYLMRHFSIMSGKSKGQFYTPSEVSRIIAKVIGISPQNAVASTTAYDPTCGSGSLLLKVAAEARRRITLEGQEKDVTTAGLARMNMILHDFPTANILSGNTLAAPKFLDKNDSQKLQTYDYVVANPPFSDKTWSTGLTPAADPFQRFKWGEPPAKQGDYAYLLHIIRSLKSTGKGACILPHGVLFRGNAEAVIRTQLVRSGYLKGIIGLPANLFYGTGIPACILVLDKENATARKGVFMIDASKGFIKDGNKNRLREQDIHRIVDIFNKQTEIPGYARMVSVEEISDPKNDYNLNLPRYIDSTSPEDLQDIDGHLRGGIPNRDIDALAAYWQVIPGVRTTLFESADRPGYARLRLPIAGVKPAIFSHPEFTAFNHAAISLFHKWQTVNIPLLKGFGKEGHSKALIATISEDLLATFRGAPLLDAYDLYQHLMDCWAETMHDDCYLIAADGWVARTARILETDKKGKTRDKGWTCDLVPKTLIVARYFAGVQAEIDFLQTEMETVTAGLAELEEEHGGEGEAFAEDAEIRADAVEGKVGKIVPAKVKERFKEIKGDKALADEAAILKKWLQLTTEETEHRKAIKEAEVALDWMAYEKYPTLTEDEIKTLVVDDKWLAVLATAVQGELDRVSQTLTGRIRQLAERYALPLPQLVDEVALLAAKVDGHLRKMGAKI
ncbi:MAG: class I SAM-dependent DNA methyltransferase [Pseudomonadota bacterium]